MLTMCKKVIDLWSNNIFFLILFLSVINVFSLNLPFPPKTSSGLIYIFTISLVPKIIFEFLRLKGKMKQTKYSPIDILIVAFFFHSFLSLAYSPTFQFLEIKILSAATLCYFFVRTSRINKIVNSVTLFLGLLSILTASLSIIQFIFPYAMNRFAEHYFFGKEIFGIVYDYNRGRLPLWGNIISTFPFFLGSFLILWKSRRRFLTTTYFLIAFSALTFYVVLSNFRWLLVTYVIGTVLFLLKIRSKRKPIFSIAAKTLVCLLLILLPLLLVAPRRVIPYTVIERFLIANWDRDVLEAAGRVNLFEQAIAFFLSSPILGIGPGNYASFDAGITRPVIVPSHNIFLTVTAEQGIVGLMLFLSIVGGTASKVLNLFRYDDTTSLPFTISFLLYVLYGQLESYSPNNTVLIFSIIGFIVSIEEKYKRERSIDDT